MRRLQGGGGAATCLWGDWARTGDTPVHTLQPNLVGLWDVPEEMSCM